MQRITPGGTPGTSLHGLVTMLISEVSQFTNNYRNGGPANDPEGMIRFSSPRNSAPRTVGIQGVRRSGDQPKYKVCVCVETGVLRQGLCCRLRASFIDDLLHSMIDFEMCIVCNDSRRTCIFLENIHGGPKVLKTTPTVNVCSKTFSITPLQPAVGFAAADTAFASRRSHHW